jgi:hypothetical protein
MRLVVWSALYWVGAIIVILFVIWATGECGLTADVDRCARNSRIVGWSVIAATFVLYGYLLRRQLRRR